jgi:hypothetical protein
VNTLRRMMRRHYPQLKRFICITDDSDGLDPGIEVYPIWSDHADVPNPTWQDGPSCFRRLKVFDPWFESVAGPRFAMLDIDMVPVADLTPIFERPEPFVIWRPQDPTVSMCASLILMDAGVKPAIWSMFDPAIVSSLTWDRIKYRGSDQGWLQAMLGEVEPGFTAKNDGVYAFCELNAAQSEPRNRFSHRRELRLRRNPRNLPPNARLVIFTGKPDPWDSAAVRVAPWLRQHYV